MLGYKLEGIPAEYYDYFYTVDDLSIQGMANKLEEVLSLSDEERHLMAERAKTFIYQNKNSRISNREIIEFFEIKIEVIVG